MEQKYVALFCFWQVMECMLQKHHVWISFPCTQQEQAHVKVMWQERFTIPHAIGTLDCTHITWKPQLHGDEYINQKGVAMINAQATCNAKDIFTSVDARWPGSVHDSRIWKASTLFQVRQKSQDILLLDDDGYGIVLWLLTPFDRNSRNPVHVHFDTVYAKEWVIIERCFGQVKQWFLILHYKVWLHLDRVPSIIMCCFMLHDVAKYLNDV